MKKRIVQALILSATMVYLGMPVVPVKGHEEIIKTDVAAQKDSTETELVLTSGVTSVVYDLINNTQQVSVVKREENSCETKINDEYAIINNEVNNAIIEMDKDMQAIDMVSDKKEYFIAYKEIVDKYSYILDPPETIYDYFTEDELNMFFCVVQAEIGDEYSFEQKCNVASVILNRINHYKFSDEMFEILTPDQFETIKNGRYKSVEVSEDTILACEYVFMFGDTTDGALFFDSNNALRYKFLFNDGAHNFYGLREE